MDTEAPDKLFSHKSIAYSNTSTSSMDPHLASLHDHRIQFVRLGCNLFAFRNKENGIQLFYVYQGIIFVLKFSRL